MLTESGRSLNLANDSCGTGYLACAVACLSHLDGIGSILSSFGAVFIFTRLLLPLSEPTLQDESGVRFLLTLVQVATGRGQPARSQV